MRRVPYKTSKKTTELAALDNLHKARMNSAGNIDNPTEDLFLKDSSKNEPHEKDLFQEDENIVDDNNITNKNIYGGQLASKNSSKSVKWSYLDSNEETSATDDIDALSNDIGKLIKLDEATKGDEVDDQQTTNEGVLATYYSDKSVLSKPAMIINVTHRANLYAKNFNAIINEARACVNITNIVDCVMRMYLPKTCIRTSRSVGRSQCNQSVFNFPVNPERALYSPTNVSIHLRELQYNVNNAETIVQNIINNTRDSKNHSDFDTAVPNAKACVSFAQRYTANIIQKAYDILNNICSVSKYIYPSVNHQLYIGDYTDIFAFLLLSYLYKVDKKKAASDVNNFTDDYMKAEFRDILSFQRGKRSATAQTSGYDVKGLYSSRTLSSADQTKTRTTTFDGLNDTSAFTSSTQKKDPVEPKSTSGSSWYKEQKIERFLKPGRFQKIILFTDPNIFAWKITPAVLKGLGIMVKAKILPESMFTSLKLCSIFSGALFNLKFNKNGLKLNVDKKYTTFANLASPQWAQYANFIDVSCIRRMGSTSATNMKFLYHSYPRAFYHSSNQYFITSERIMPPEALANLGIPNNVSGSVFHGNNKLVCETRRHFTKALDDKALPKYAAIANIICYGHGVTAAQIVKLGVWSAEFPEPPPRGDYRTFKKIPDISIDEYKKGYPYGESTSIAYDQAIKIYTNQYNYNQGTLDYENINISLSTEEEVDMSKYDLKQKIGKSESIKDFIIRRKNDDKSPLYGNLIRFIHCVNGYVKNKIKSSCQNMKEALSLINDWISYADPSRKVIISRLSQTHFNVFFTKKEKVDMRFDTDNIISNFVELYYRLSQPDTESYLYKYIENSIEFGQFAEEIVSTVGNNNRQPALEYMSNNFIYFICLFICKKVLEKLESQEVDSHYSMQEGSFIDEQNSSTEKDEKEEKRRQRNSREKADNNDV